MNHLEIIKNILNLFNAHSGEELSSVHADQSRNPLTECPPRPTVPPSPPNPSIKAFLKEVMMEQQLDGVTPPFEAIWISAPSTVTPFYKGIYRRSPS